jgi:hypothetical protein
MPSRYHHIVPRDARHQDPNPFKTPKNPRASYTRRHRVIIVFSDNHFPFLLFNAISLPVVDFALMVDDEER